LIAASGEDKVLTESFTTGWPNAPHRVLSSAVEAAERLDGSVAATLGEQEIARFAPLRARVRSMAADRIVHGTRRVPAPHPTRVAGRTDRHPEIGRRRLQRRRAGMIPNPSSAVEVERVLTIARGLTTGPLGVGFLVPFVVREAVDAAAKSADVVEFFYGDPTAELVRLAGARGARVG
jgi:hypothetical protein